MSQPTPRTDAAYMNALCDHTKEVEESMRDFAIVLERENAALVEAMEYIVKESKRSHHANFGIYRKAKAELALAKGAK